jgi:RHS repeat-associated protein
MTSNEFASYAWDAASRITSITQTLWAQKTVTAVVNGRPQTVTQAYQAPITWAAGYDARNRLTSFARTGAGTTYSYDANSNRVSATETSSSELDLEAAFDAPNFTESASQSLDIDAASNKLLGFTQTLTRTLGGTPVGSATSRVSYSVDANGAMSSDGLRTFEYDESRRLSKVKILKDGEAAAVDYLHTALGQRVFKSQVLAEQTLPDEKRLGRGFIDWLREGFGWLFTRSRPHKATLGLSFAYDEDANLIGEYDNGSAQGLGSTEYIWLPVDGSNAIPVGIYRNGKLYQVHSDHLGTPRLVTDNTNAPVWQWPYSAFGNNRTTGVLSATTTSSGQMTLRATKAPVAVNLRFPGQYWDDESNLSYNYFRSYRAGDGGYTQPDPIGLGGGLNRRGYVNGDPLRFTDPLGTCPLLALPLVIGGGITLGDLAIGTGLAAGVALVFNESKKPNQSTDPAVQRQKDYMRAKRFCDTPPPAGGNECSNLAKQIAHAKEVIRLYQEWDSKWLPGRHSDKLNDWKQRLENLKKEHNDKCTNKCP